MDKSTMPCPGKAPDYSEWNFVNDISAVIKDENAIVEILLSRMDHRSIYTWVGPVLLALNPGKHIEDLYDKKQQKFFDQGDKDYSPNSAPHVYAVANRARYRLVHGLGKVNQVILISGESGTGKTFNARKALEFLATRNGIVSKNSGSDVQADRSCEAIIHKIGNTVPLVSAFTTARTARNAKSSRHGQMLRLQYDQHGVIRGASIQSFLFERTRVTECSDNFEIFYQLMYGLSDEAIAELFLSRDQNYTVLGVCDWRDTRYFAEEFRETLASFVTLGFTDQCRIDIFRIIAFLVHLGNIRFEKTIGEGVSVDVTNKDSKNALRNACSLMSFAEYELTQLLTSTLICPQSSRGRHTSYRRYLTTPEDCRNRLFSIARFIYDRLFNWLVERINETLYVTGNNYHWLGLLDIFGFESFDYNGLEQLCINYTTERLQLYFMEDYLEAGQRELEEEGLGKLPTSASIELYRSRLFVIENIVFSTFNDASQSPIALNSSTLLQQLHSKQKENSRFLTMKNNVFIIEHYSCSVEYNVNNLLSKNTDKVPMELSSVFGICKNTLLLSLLENKHGSYSQSRGPQNKSTTLAKLKISLDCLIKELNKCDSHYVRCAKPRHLNGAWATQEFKKQLADTGIFDTLPLARWKLPVRFQYDEFHKRYSIRKTEILSDLIRNLQKILSLKDFSGSIHFGKRLIFFTENIFADLENYRTKLRSRCAQKIQLFWIKTRQKRRAKIFAQSTDKIQYPTTSAKPVLEPSAKNRGPIQGYNDVLRKTIGKVKTLQVSLILSADTGYSSNMTIGEEFQLLEIKSQRLIEIPTYSSQDHSRNGALKVDRRAPIECWKNLYVRNWLNAHSVETRRKHKAEFPRDSTLIVGSDKLTLYYRNRILSRRLPEEIPVKFHTRLTCLTHSHRLPHSLRPRGLQDCLFQTIFPVVEL